MIQVTVALPSGRSASLSVMQSCTVGDLKALARESLGQSFSRLVTADGRILTNPMESLEAAGLQDGDWLTAMVGQTQLAATFRPFLCAALGANVSLGRPQFWWCSSTSAEECAANSGHSFCICCHSGRWFRGDMGQARIWWLQLELCSPKLAEERAADSGIKCCICCHPGRWLRGDMGPFICGGDSSAVQDQLKNVQQIQATPGAFAAILQDGSCVTWGNAYHGGDSSAVQHQLKSVHQIQATWEAFAAILQDGFVVTWGDPEKVGDSSAVQHQLRNVQQIQATREAFAAILEDGSVVTWGSEDDGGDSSAIQDQLRNVQQIQATRRAFAAILEDGSVVTWGDPDQGGNSSAVHGQLRHVQQIQATDSAFAAIVEDGSVVTWGNPHCGGDSSAVQHQLNNSRFRPQTTHLPRSCRMAGWLAGEIPFLGDSG